MKHDGNRIGIDQPLWIFFGYTVCTVSNNIKRDPVTMIFLKGITHTWSHRMEVFITWRGVGLANPWKPLSLNGRHHFWHQGNPSFWDKPTILRALSENEVAPPKKKEMIANRIFLLVIYWILAMTSHPLPKTRSPDESSIKSDTLPLP